MPTAALSSLEAPGGLICPGPAAASHGLPCGARGHVDSCPCGDPHPDLGGAQHSLCAQAAWTPRFWLWTQDEDGQSAARSATSTVLFSTPSQEYSGVWMARIPAPPRLLELDSLVGT